MLRLCTNTPGLLAKVLRACMHACLYMCEINPDCSIREK